MKKSVSIKDELVYKVQDQVYVKRAADPKDPTSFSQVVNQALEYFFQSGCPEVKM